MSATTLPPGFGELERFVADWAKPTREERYRTRLAKSIDELTDLYDAVAARAEEAIAHLAGLDLDPGAAGEVDADATRLLQLLYSMILVSYAVNVFKQPKIPDSGSAYFDCVVEPAV